MSVIARLFRVRPRYHVAHLNFYRDVSSGDLCIVHEVVKHRNRSSFIFVPVHFAVGIFGVLRQLMKFLKRGRFIGFHPPADRFFLSVIFEPNFDHAIVRRNLDRRPFERFFVVFLYGFYQSLLWVVPNVLIFFEIGLRYLHAFSLLNSFIVGLGKRGLFPRGVSSINHSVFRFPFFVIR